MKSIKRITILSILAIGLASMVFLPTNAGAASAAQLDGASRAALNSLIERNPKAAALDSRAVAVLVFPEHHESGIHGRRASRNGRSHSR